MGLPIDGVRTWTHHLNRGSIEGAHAVEFSKTVVPLVGGGSSRGYARDQTSGSRSGQSSIALEDGRDGRWWWVSLNVEMTGIEPARQDWRIPAPFLLVQQFVG